MIFSDEYLYYNPTTDQLAIQVYSQGLSGPYYIMGVKEDGTEIAVYPQVWESAVPTDWVLIDVLQQRSEFTKSLGRLFSGY